MSFHHNIYPYPWPIGTCHYNQLPADIQTSLAAFITAPDILDESLVVHQTPTEGPYVSWAGWKIRVMIQNTSPTTYIVRLV